MQCKTSLGLLLAGSLAWSCTGKKVELSRGEGFAFFKNPESNQACVNKNLSQWELSGSFLHKMLICASNRSSEGGETLPATQNLLRSLDAEKLQKLVDFALTPAESASTHEERYPYLLALASILDRGLTDGRKQGLELSAERLDQLQPFLLSLDPARIQSQMLIWSKSGKLEQLLSQLGLFLQSLEDDSLSALSREVLAGSNFGPRFIRVSDAILSQNQLMNSLDSALSGTPLLELTAESRSQQLNDWRQPRSSDTQASAMPAPVQTTSDKVSFAQHLNQFSSQLSDAEIANLSSFLTSFWNSYRGLPAQDRLFLSKRLVTSLEQSLDQQKNPAQWLLAVAEDLSSMPAADLNNISETLGNLLGSNDPSLDTLRSKLWSSRMMEQMLDLISKGGPIPGCSGLSIQGLKDLPSDDFAATYEVLRMLNQPHSACNQQVPLTMALETWSKVAIGRSCTDADCLELASRENSAQVTASYWSQSFREPDAETMQKLVRTTLERARQELIRDQFYLRNLGIAHRAVTPAVMDQLLQTWNEKPARNLKELAVFDLHMMLDPRFQAVFSADPMEKLLGLEVEQLSGLSQQFDQLLPDTGRELDKASNQRAARVFAGAYSSGPLEQALRYKLPATGTGSDDILQDPTWNWPEDVRKTFTEQRSLLSHFLFRFKKADSIFRNPELGSLSDGAEIPVAGLGSPSRYMSFDETGEVSLIPNSDSQLIQPLQTIRRWSDDDNSSWGLWNQQLASSPLVSKDLPPEQMANFESFSVNFMDQMSQENRWKDLFAASEPVWSQSSPSITPDFYEVEPYSPGEARLIALYYLRHYHKLPHAFPNKKIISPLSTGSIRGFFSASALVSRMDADYSLFVKLFPEQLAGSTATLEELSRESVTVGSDGLLFPPTKIKQVTRVGLLAGKYPALLTNPNFRLLSSLNLLGLTKSSPTEYYIQPLVGISDKTCVAADGKPTNCAIELQSDDPNSQAKDYQTFIADVLAQNFCPLIASDRFGNRETWSQRLQLKTSAASTCSSPRVTLAPVASELQFPAWLTKRIFNDVFSMGRHAQLKQGLAQIPAAMRFYKLSQQELTNEQRTALFLRQARGDWNALNAASQSRRQFYAVQFWSGQPNLLNAYIDHWKQGIEPTSWTDFLTRLARRDGDGTSRDIVHELLSLIISTQQQNAKEGRSLLEMGLDLMEKISSRPDLIDAAGHVFGNFASSENYDFAGRDLPFAMTLFTSFNWNDAGLRFSKFISQQETIKVWSILCESFSPDEFGRLIRQIQASSLSLGTKSERSALLAKFLRENVELGSLWDPAQEHTLSLRWDGILSAWRHADFGADFTLQWEALLSTLDLPLKTLDGRSSYKTSEIMELWLPKILRQGMGLMSLHQDIGAVPETAFWSKVGLNFVQAIESEPLGSRALSSFLAEPKLGFIQGGIWIKALTMPSARHSMAEALSSLSAVSENLWREALVESSQLLGRLGKAFGYMKQRMVWKEDPEHNAFRQVIDQLYALSSDATLREDQIALLNAWFRDDDAPGTAISLE